MTYDNRCAAFITATVQSASAGVYSSDPNNEIPLNQDFANVHPALQDTMNMPTREEIDAKLETIEVRMDGRVASIEAKIDGLVARMDQRMSSIESTVKDTQASIGNLKSTTIVTAIGAVLTIVLGVAAFNATVLSNMVASFESGKNTSAAQSEVKRQSEETAALLKQIQQQVNNSRDSSRSGQEAPPK